MRSAHIHLVREDEIEDILAEYAEFNWVERTEQRLKKDAEAKWQLQAVLMAGALFVVMYVIPAIWKALR